MRDREPHATAMALRTAPPPPSDGLLARGVETPEELLAAGDVQLEAFATPGDEVARQRAALIDSWPSAVRIMHAVWLEGEIAGAGTCAWTQFGLALFGGATSPRARSRGAYRALIHARWREALARDRPALITQANAMSWPILARLGFEAVGHVEMLVDELDPAA